MPEINPVAAQVLYARKIDTLERTLAFLNPEDEEVGDPFRLAGMTEAVARLGHALRHGERIAVYGDFDVDGVAATALLVSALQALGGQAFPFIPDRFSEGYGLNEAALGRLSREGTQLVVTADCGIRSVAEIEYASALGLPVIITDHHSVPDPLPQALVIINPKMSASDYPFRDLSGVGVAYRVAEALFRTEGGRQGAKHASLDPGCFLDLVALGTVADVVPLIGENRTLVRLGLAQLRASPRVGVGALVAVCGLAIKDVDSQAVAFRLAPRLNAAGRLEHASLAYELLMTRSPERAQELSHQLNRINQERQHLLSEQVEEARALLEGATQERILIVDGPAFHEGIVGLVASRLVEEFYRPTLVMRQEKGFARGSARSIEGFHITEALDACKDLLLRYGGHARAAGFSLRTEALPAFRERLRGYCDDHLDESTLKRRILVDAIVSLDEIDGETPAALDQLGPFGEGNPAPALASLGVRLMALRCVGQDGRHLRLELGNGRRTFPAIAFRQGHLAEQFSAGDVVDLVYRPTLNEWQGVTSLQLVVRAMRATSTQ